MSSEREEILAVTRTHEVVIATGSKSDWEKGKGPAECEKLLRVLGVLVKGLIVSAHRTPDRVKLLAEAVEGVGSKVRVVIAAAGGAAHLPGMLAAHMHTTPVIGIPIKSSTLSGIDSLYSIVQMPPGVPVATMAIGGGVNAAIFAAQILACFDVDTALILRNYRAEQTDGIDLEPPKE